MKSFTFFILSSFALLTVNAQIRTDSLAAHYPINGNANDVSGNFLHGTVGGATLTTDRFGMINSAYYFDGINDTINVRNHNGKLTFDADEKFSISLWFMADSIYQGVKAQHLVSHKAGALNGIIISIHRITNKIKAAFEGDANISYSLSSEDTIISKSWYHVCVVYDGMKDSAYIYLNNELQNEMKTGTDLTGFLGNISIPFSFGKRVGNLDENHFHGSLDDIRIYNDILSKDEISELYYESNCVITFYDTITVEDTLNIDVQLVEIPQPDNINEVKVYPNPANDILWIDCGDFSKMSNYELRIIDALSSELWSTTVTQQEYDINILSTFPSTGIYFLDRKSTRLNSSHYS